MSVLLSKAKCDRRTDFVDLLSVGPKRVHCVYYATNVVIREMWCAREREASSRMFLSHAEARRIA